MSVGRHNALARSAEEEEEEEEREEEEEEEEEEESVTPHGNRLQDSRLAKDSHLARVLTKLAQSREVIYNLSLPRSMTFRLP